MSEGATTLSIMDFFATLSLMTLSETASRDERRYADCRYAERRVFLLLC
jgi:hypothetical protein